MHHFCHYELLSGLSRTADTGVHVIHNSLLRSRDFPESLMIKIKNMFSYTLSRDYRVAGNRYSRLLFTSEIAFAPICACKKNRRK